MKMMNRFKVGDRVRSKSAGLTCTIIAETDDMWLFQLGYNKKVFGKKRFVKQERGIFKDDDRWELVPKKRPSAA